jgi:hypothetical protein
LLIWIIAAFDHSTLRSNLPLAAINRGAFRLGSAEVQRSE